VYVSLIAIGYILMCLTIDFWPRYLVFLIPILIVIVGKILEKRPFILILILISYLPWLWFNFFPKNNTVTEKYDELLNKEQYRDAYRLLSKETLEKIDEDKWMKMTERQGKPILENNLWKIEIK